MALKTDKNGMIIGNGEWHVDFHVEDMTGYPVEVRVDKSITTESVYVYYTNVETLKKVAVRFSTHYANESPLSAMVVKMNGAKNQRDEILHILGLKKARIVNICVPYFKKQNVKSSRIGVDLELCDMTCDELKALPVGAELPKGKCYFEGNMAYIILSDKVYSAKRGESVEYYD